ncbi:unnamed protein product [Coregonus sp. 'balchen']|nr:unnamed protein product [Coregonus sp. 'balchen']
MCKGLATLPATCLKSAKDIKHKIGFLLQKPEFPPDQKPVKEKTTAAKRGSPADVEKWKLSFNDLMNCEGCDTEQEQHLLRTIQALTSTTDSLQRMRDSISRYERARIKVNLDSATREETRQNLSIAGLSCFDNAQQKIFTLMEKDSYRRFLCSKLIQDLSLLPTTTPLCVLKMKGGKIGCSENRCGA